MQITVDLGPSLLSPTICVAAAAMVALNAKGIVHRDLKPQNILLCHRGKPNASPNEIRLKIGKHGHHSVKKPGKKWGLLDSFLSLKL